ncbi:MAG: hypothetical protein IPM63_04885 [Acidobacteriota bacterium]|nr:MAG: hypothetical protein IPM63_04885 [Acidobacteriota bacterium]
MKAPEDYIPIRVLHDFVGRLESLGIDYMLTGSMAMMRYTVFRQTADIDVIVDLQLKSLRNLIDSLEPDYYVPHGRARRAVETRRMFNVIHQDTAFKVDCVIKKQDAFQRTSFERREKTDYYGRPAYVISKEDLILSKLNWAKESRSEMQQRDIANLLRTGFDETYVAEWAGRLGVEDLLSKCREEATG